MGEIIALIWDFDKTLVDGYMQAPIFAHYGVEEKPFWNEVNQLPKSYADEDIRVNPDTIYLNVFIREAQPGGKFEGLNNKMLRDFGKELKFYPGVEEFFSSIKNKIENDQICKDSDIKLEHYIVSTGLRQVIEGCNIRQYVEYVWGCEFIEKEDSNGNRVISEVGYSIDNTSKTRALFEINKGINKERSINVNDKIPKELRRIPFENMIYIADGPSDVPAFSLLNKQGGATFAVYPEKDKRALKQVEKLRKEGRVNMLGEANYTEGSTTQLWLETKVEEISDRIVNEKRQRLLTSVSTAPQHLN